MLRLFPHLRIEFFFGKPGKDERKAAKKGKTDPLIKLPKSGSVPFVHLLWSFVPCIGDSRR